MGGLNRIAAEISEQVYKDPKDSEVNCGYGDLSGWKFLKRSDKSSDGYFAAAFGFSKSVIIASRGTEMFDLKDLRNDIKIFIDQPLEQLNSAAKFAELVISEYKNQGVEEFIFVGHSLGGLISQILSIRFDCRAITFDSLGAYRVAAKYFDRGLFDTSKITSFLSAPNLINSNSPHLTKELHFIEFFTDPGKARYIDYLKYSQDQHSIKNIVKQFDSFDDIPERFSTHNFWPNGRLSGFMYYLRNDELWKAKLKQRSIRKFWLNDKREEELSEMNSLDIGISGTFLSDLPGSVYGAKKIIEGISIFFSKHFHKNEE